MLKKYLLAGLLVWLPLWATLLVLRFLINVMDNVFLWLPTGLQPDNLLGSHVPGLGLIFSLVILFVTGLLVTNFLGRRLVAWWELLLANIPIVRSIYSAIKQVLETLLSSSSDSFKQVLLVEYPRRGLWSIAFQTGQSYQDFNTAAGQEMVNIFIPTTPNPTSGFLMMVNKDEAIPLDISVDDALKWLISLGVIQPTPRGAVPKQQGQGI